MSELDDKLAELKATLQNAMSYMEIAMADTEVLVQKAKALVDMLDDAERNHGGLYAGKTMRAANELRLELQRWK